MPSEGMASNVHRSALQLALRTRQHTSKEVVSLHASSRVESVLDPECLVPGTRVSL